MNGDYMHMITESKRTCVSSSIMVTENGIMTPNGIFEYDIPKSAAEHFNDFCSAGSRGLLLIDKVSFEPVKTIASEEDLANAAHRYNLAIRCGVDNGLAVLSIGANHGSFVPELKPGRYGVVHANLGSLVTKTKRIITGSASVSLIFGIQREEWPDGLNSCMLVQPDLEGRGSINLLADNSYQLIEPSINPITAKAYRFYTPFQRILGAGSGFAPDKIKHPSETYPLYQLGIMTLNRPQLSELLRAFSKDWSNGPVFARKHSLPRPLVEATVAEGLDE